MAESRIDTISPLEVGEDRISVTLDPASLVVEGKPISVQFDYADADVDGGVVLPLVVSVQPAFGDGAGFQRDVFRSNRPSQFTFLVDKAGEYLITIRESAHNQWQGRLLLNVEGNRFTLTEGRT